MLSIIKKIKDKQNAKNRNKVIVVSLFTGIVSSLTTLFFSKKENRAKVSNGAKAAGQKVGEYSQQAKEEMSNLFTKAKAEINNLIESAKKAKKSNKKQDSESLETSEK